VPILTPAKFREHQSTALGDPALQDYIDAAEAAIVGRYGPIAEFTDRRGDPGRPGGTYLYTSRRVGTITSVTERYGDVLGITDVVMNTNDYTLLPDGLTLRREYTGAHPAQRWTEVVVVVYTPYDDTASRLRVAIALVKLDLAHNPGIVSESIGDYSATYAPRTAGAANYDEERDAILSTLQPLGLGFA
jgi:hypothetical protein